MTILAAATLDFIEQLKQRSRGRHIRHAWMYEPLVMVSDDELKHASFVTVKSRLNHISATQFYIDDPPTGVSTLIKAKTKGQYPRLIELRLAPGPDAKLRVKYWRVNGWQQTKMSIEDEARLHSPHLHLRNPVQQDGKTNFKVYAMERVTKRRRGTSTIHRDVIDLTTQKSAEYVAKLTILTLEKSLKKIHGETTSHKNRSVEKLSNWSILAVVLDGKNFVYDDIHPLRAEIVYG